MKQAVFHVQQSRRSLKTVKTIEIRLKSIKNIKIIEHQGKNNAKYVQFQRKPYQKPLKNNEKQ